MRNTLESCAAVGSAKSSTDMADAHWLSPALIAGNRFRLSSEQISLLSHNRRDINDLQPEMDGISAAASVVGLLQGAEKAINFISTAAEASSTVREVLAEASALQVIFYHLQDLILDFGDGSREDRKSMIYVDHLVAVLTGCVCAFNDLENVLGSLSVPSGIDLWSRAKWSFYDKDLGRILNNLQRHKSSLNTMMTIMTWFVTARCHQH